MVAPLTDPVMADFVANLEPINALADHGPSPHAFTFRQFYPSPDTPARAVQGSGVVAV
jgi:hypothetical protein